MLVLRPANADERKVGVELDLLPYLTGGYYGSLSWAQDEWRYRAVVAKVDLPAWIIPDGFDRHTQSAYALILDYFYEHQVNGWWSGIGFEYWRNEVREASSQESAVFWQGIVTVGQGYVWRINDYFYINPWGAIHVPLQTDTVRIASRDYHPLPVLGEISVKFGLLF